MKPWIRNIFLPVLLMLLSAPAFAAAADTAAVNSTEKAEEEQVDVQGIIFGHINDSYEWHITDIGDKPVAIPLPVIIHSKTSGWHCFMSSKIAHGHEHDGFYISTSEKYDGKIVEKGPDGEEIRPLDISITKNVLSLIISSALLVTLILGSAIWNKKPDLLKEAPKGIAALL